MSSAKLLLSLWVCLLPISAFTQTTAPLNAADGTWLTPRGNQYHTGLQTMKGKLSDVNLKWQFTPLGVNIGTEGEPVIADVNNDGKNEVVIAMSSGIHVLNGETGAVIWETSGLNNFGMGPAVADVDGDGIYEIFAGNTDGVYYAFSGGNGNMIWSQFTLGGLMGGSTVADLDGDGIYEVVFSDMIGTVYVRTAGNGNIVWSYSGSSTDIQGVPVVVDVDGNGIKEIIVTSFDGNVFMLNSTFPTEIWSYTTTGAITSTPAIADVNNNGSLEVIFGTDTGDIIALNANSGTLVWIYTSIDFFNASVAVGDIDEDGTTELVIAGQNNRLHAINGEDGSGQWMIDLMGTGSRFSGSPKIGDFDLSVPGLEILVSTSYNWTGGNTMLLYDANGDNIWTYSALDLDTEGISIGDIDNDCCVEIVANPSSPNWEPVIFAFDDISNAIGCSGDLLDVEIDFRDLCLGDMTDFSLIGTGLEALDSVLWDFGDPGSAPNNNSNVLNPSHVFSNSGTFTVTVMLFHACEDTLLSTSLTIIDPDTLELGEDISTCDTGSPIILDATVDDAIAYEWQDGSTNPTFMVTESGTYWVNVNTECEILLSDTIVINIDANIPPVVNLGEDGGLCEGESVVLDVTQNASTYVWQDGSTASTFTVSEAGIYWVTVTNICGVTTDSITLTFEPIIAPIVSLGNDTSLCNTSAFELVVSGNATAFEWQDGSTNATFIATESGTYSVTGFNECSSTTDAIHLTFTNELLSVTLGADMEICTGESFTLNATQNSAVTYSWQNGSTAPTLTLTEPGTYAVTVTGECSSASDEIQVSLGECPDCIVRLPTAFSPNNDGFNEQFRIVYRCDFGNVFDFRVYNRWGENVFQSHDPDTPWEGLCDRQACEIGVYVWMLHYTDDQGMEQVLKGNVTLLR